MTHIQSSKHLIDVRHPQYSHDELYWSEWRECYDGGPLYVEHNLKQFDRESSTDFNNRKFYTPIEMPAAGAVNDIRNSIFQRLRDVIRRDGSEAYIKACAGENGGVDNKGSTMQSFIGIEVLTELLIMGRVGIYVDMPRLYGESMADVGDVRPYMYKYDVEDILSWAPRKPEEPGDFSAVLLRDRGVAYNQAFPWGGHLPSGDFTRFRYMWINETTGLVNMKIYNQDEVPVDLDGNPLIEDGSEIFELGLTRIPFIMPSIGGSILKNVYKHQVALLNLGSSDVSYALKANFPFLTEQTIGHSVGGHLKRSVSEEGTTVTSENDTAGREIKAGTVHGRTYPLKAERPQFIHPSPEPLMASMKLQEKIEDSIRKNVNLAVQNKTGQRAVSAEAMKLSDQGLEAGLSFIGLVLEGTERKAASYWAAYEHKDPVKRQVAVVKYPDRYSLKDDTDRIKEAQELSQLMYAVPGQTVKRELSKNIVTVLLSHKISPDQLSAIFGEIDEADYTTSDPETIIRAHEAGIVGDETASKAIGFADDEYIQAREDHVSRATRVLEAQAEIGLKAKIAEAQAAASGQLGAPAGGTTTDGQELGVDKAGARGVDDLALERGESKDEKLEEDGTKKPQRGPGKSLNKGE